MILINDLIKFRNAITDILSGYTPDKLKNLDSFSDHLITEYHNTLREGKHLYQLYYVFMMKFLLDNKDNVIHRLLLHINKVTYTRLLMKYEKLALENDNYLADHFADIFVADEFTKINSYKTNTALMSDIIYKLLPEEYYNKANFIFSNYSHLDIELCGKQYTFYKSTKRNEDYVSDSSVACFSSRHISENLKNARLMMPMVFECSTENTPYSDQTCYVIGKISRNMALVQHARDTISEYQVFRFPYNIKTKYHKIYMELDSFNNTGLEDILSLMSFSKELQIHGANYYNSAIFRDIEDLKDWLHIYTFVKDDSVIYDCQRILHNRLSKLKTLPKGYFEKYILNESFYAENKDIMLEEFIKGCVL